MHSMLTRRFGGTFLYGRAVLLTPGREEWAFRQSDAKAEGPKVGCSFFCAVLSTPDGILKFYHPLQLFFTQCYLYLELYYNIGSGCQEHFEAMPRHLFHPHNHQRWEMLPEVRDAGLTSPFRKPRRWSVGLKT
jgi:hypothetical protein